ncbi:minor glycoprotein [Kibale red colobus virus 2]|uniref:Minor glycoprotein n=1 Tax=Kibale red colobus virus 2 TaxID=1936072 RepID=X2D7M1_9NIDO|nr:minor glycoprotein [Kibale red colobus virus 2]AHH54250.1 minor glycoprotein [Kibale red colobus virus 2]
MLSMSCLYLSLTYSFILLSSYSPCVSGNSLAWFSKLYLGGEAQLSTLNPNALYSLLSHHCHHHIISYPEHPLGMIYADTLSRLQADLATRHLRAHPVDLAVNGIREHFHYRDQCSHLTDDPQKAMTPILKSLDHKLTFLFQRACQELMAVRYYIASNQTHHLGSPWRTIMYVELHSAAGFCVFCSALSLVIILQSVFPCLTTIW